jgi:hypothetical protein
MTKKSAPGPGKKNASSRRALRRKMESAKQNAKQKKRVTFEELQSGSRKELERHTQLANKVVDDFSVSAMESLLANNQLLNHIASTRGVYFQLLKSAIEKRLEELK